MLRRFGQHMLLVEEDVTPLLVLVEVIRKMETPIHVGECIPRHALLQRRVGIKGALYRPASVDQQKSLEQPALLISKHL